MHVYTAECIHSHMPTGKTDRDKQSSSTWMDPLVNDIQNQEVNLSATWHWHWGHRWNEVQATKGKQKCLVMTYLVQAEAHAFLLYRENKPVHAYSRWSMSKNKDAQYCLARLAIFCCSAFKEAAIVTRICWAIDVVQEIPYGKRQPATSGRTHWETC